LINYKSEIDFVPKKMNLIFVA